MCSLEKRGRVFVLTLTGDGEHRLSPASISSIRSALSRVRSDSSSSGGRGFALVTASSGRFFSNGFDLGWARSAGSPSASRSRLHSMVSLFRPLVADLLSLPMPTVAAVSGHAAAAGFVLALSHDYVDMRADRGVLYMSELDIGMPFPPYFLALLRAKISDRRAMREVVLEGRRIGGAEAAAKGIVDGAHVGGEEAVVEAAVRRAEGLAARDWVGEVYGSIRMGTLAEARDAVGLPEETEEGREKLLAASKL